MPWSFGMPEQHKRRWVFIRGLARHAGHWGPFVKAFQNAFPSDDFEMLDTRGNGTECHVPSYLSIEENVRDLRLRSKLLKQGPVHLLSISLGAMMAIEWESKQPQEVAALVCINTSDSSHSHFYERLRPGNYQKMLQLPRHLKDPKKMEQIIMQMVAPHCPEAEFWVDEFAKFPTTSMKNLLRQLYAATHFKLPLTPPHCSSRILIGQGDNFVSPKCSERIAKMWGIEPIYHPTAGHDISLEDPHWVCEQIKGI